MAPSDRNLLRTLTDNAQLPAWVPEQPARAIGHLIDHIGREDAGELLALTTPTQLAEILDERLWLQNQPGADELFSAGAFLGWCDVLLGVGEAFAAERLASVGSTWLQLSVARVCDVVDLTSAAAPAAEHRDPTTSGSWGEFLVSCPNLDVWDVLRRVLDALWRHDPDFLEAVLRPCAASRTTGATGLALQADAAHDREFARQQQGYVTPANATLFLAATRDTDLDVLAGDAEDDPGITAWLRQMVEQSTQEAAASGNADGDAELADDADMAPYAGETAVAATEPDPAARADRMALDATLADLLPAGSVALFEAKEHQGGAAEVRATLRVLGEIDPPEFGARMREIAMLANILLSGTTWRGEAMSEQTAGDAAIACVALGCDWLVREGRAEDMGDVLAESGSAVQGFRIGWRLLTALPAQTVALVYAVLYQDGPGSPLKVAPWAREQVARVLSNHNLVREVAEGEFGAARRALEMLAIAFDNQTCAALGQLVDPFPGLPNAIAEPDVERLRVDRGQRLVDSIADLVIIQKWLEDLPARMR